MPVFFIVPKHSFTGKRRVCLSLQFLNFKQLNMADLLDVKVNEFMAKVIARNPGESEFHQAVKEVVESLMPVVEENPKYKFAKILERMTEPERVILFRVPWVDDNGEIHINKGYRIEMNSAIGPY